MHCTLLWFLAASYAAAFILEKRDRKTLIGFRRLSEEEVNIYYTAGFLYWKPLKDRRSGDQLGMGIYGAMGYADYPSWKWECDIYVDADKWDAVNKAWVPATYVPEGGSADCPTVLWDKEFDENRMAYLKSLDETWTISNTVLIGPIKGMEYLTQILIPPALLPYSNPLGTELKCVEVGTPLQMAIEAVNPTVPWQGWANFKGLPLS